MCVTVFNIEWVWDGCDLWGWISWGGSLWYIIKVCDMYQSLWYVSKFVICIKACGMYQSLWYVSKLVVCIKACGMYQRLWYVSKLVVCIKVCDTYIKVCDMYQSLWYVSKSCTQRIEDIRQAGRDSNWMFPEHSDTYPDSKHEHIDNSQLQNNNTR